MLNHIFSSCFSFGRIKINLLILFSFLLLFPLGSSLNAAPPDDGRPYLELPFAGETRYRVTCAYDCYQHRGRMYYAVDFAIPEGEPIVAAAAGEVMAVTWEMGLPANLNLGDALILYLDHGNGWFTRYVHLDGVTVEVGHQVEMGDVIGYGGKTGAMGDHLHFELKHGTSLHSPSVPINELFGGLEPNIGQSYASNNWTLQNRALANAMLVTPSATIIPSATVVPSATPTLVPSATPTAIASATPSATGTAMATETATPSPTAGLDEPIEEVVLWHKPQVQDPANIISRENQAQAPTIAASASPIATASRTITAEPTLPPTLQPTAQPTAISAAPQIKESFYLLPRIETSLSLSTASIKAGETITATFTLRNATEERLHLDLLGVAARRVGDITPLEDSLFFDRFIVLNPGRSYNFTKSHTFEKEGEFELFVFALGEHNEWIPLDGMGQIAPLSVGQSATTLFLPIINK